MVQSPIIFSFIFQGRVFSCEIRFEISTLVLAGDLHGGRGVGAA